MFVSAGAERRTASCRELSTDVVGLVAVEL